MAAKKGIEKKIELFEEIITDIADNGRSLISALKGRMSSQTFYAMIEADKKMSKRYARACEDRADKMADEILAIADATEDDIIKTEDGREIPNHNVINRDRLRVDSRKWLLAKLHPKKYGEKVDLTSDNKPLPSDIKVTYINKIDGNNSEQGTEGSE